MFAKWLPHSWSDDRNTRFVAGNKNDAREVCYEITRVLRDRVENKEGVNERNNVMNPHYIIFIDNNELLEDEILSKYIYDPMLSCGITAVIMVESYDDLPNECEYIIENTHSYTGIYNVQNIDNRVDIKFDEISGYNVLDFARQLSKIRLKEANVEGEVPTMLTFLEMYGVKKPGNLMLLTDGKRAEHTKV